MWAHMGSDAACVDTIDTLMKAQITPHLSKGRLCVRVEVVIPFVDYFWSNSTSLI